MNDQEINTIKADMDLVEVSIQRLDHLSRSDLKSFTTTIGCLLFIKYLKLLALRLEGYYYHSVSKEQLEISLQILDLLDGGSSWEKEEYGTNK